MIYRLHPSIASLAAQVSVQAHGPSRISRPDSVRASESAMLGEAMARHLAFPHCSTPFARDRQARTSTGKFARTMQQEGGRCSSPPWVRSAQRHRDASPYRQGRARSEEHTSELQSLTRNTYAVICMKKKKYK